MTFDDGGRGVDAVVQTRLESFHFSEIGAFNGTCDCSLSSNFPFAETSKYRPSRRLRHSRRHGHSIPDTRRCAKRRRPKPSGVALLINDHM
jgi:hypothetical protein